MESVQQKFKVGDRVQIDWSRTGYLYDGYSMTGMVQGFKGGRVRLSRIFPGDLEHSLLFNGGALTLIPTDPVPRPEIVLDGHRYVLAPAAEAVAEVPEVKAGQVWHVFDEYVILDNDGYNVSLRDGYRGGLDHAEVTADGTFVAPSLADALASGTLTADLLRGES